VEIGNQANFYYQEISNILKNNKNTQILNNNDLINSINDNKESISSLFNSILFQFVSRDVVVCSIIGKKLEVILTSSIIRIDINNLLNYTSTF